MRDRMRYPAKPEKDIKTNVFIGQDVEVDMFDYTAYVCMNVISGMQLGNRMLLMVFPGPTRTRRGYCLLIVVVTDSVTQCTSFLIVYIIAMFSFTGDLVRAMRKEGWNGSDDGEERNLQWTFAGALFYSIIVITTIGYGHIAPKTTLGKVATIFYAIVGIPLMLLCLSNIGDIMAHSFRFLYWKVCCYACTRPRKPPEFSRRTKSIRGRMPARSLSARPASFRRHIRTSTRSADYALGGTDGMNGRAAHSDTECGYYDEMERDYQMRGLRPPRQHMTRASQWSRHMDTPSSGRRHQSRLAEHSRSNQNLRYSGGSQNLRYSGGAPDSPRARGDYNKQKHHRSPSRARTVEADYPLSPSNQIHRDPLDDDGLPPTTPPVLLSLTDYPLSPSNQIHRDPLDDDGLPPTTPPVLYNKYALDRDESQRVNSLQAQQYRNRMRRGKSAIPEGSKREHDLEMGRTLPSRHDEMGRRSLPPSRYEDTGRRSMPPRYDDMNRRSMPPRYDDMGRRSMPPTRYNVEMGRRSMPPSRQHLAVDMSPPISHWARTRQKDHPPPPIEFDYYPQDFDFFTEYYDTKGVGNAEQIKPVPIWLCVFLVISYIIGGAFLFSHWEPWGFPDSAYFCFITLTTIGFGDFVPAQKVQVTKSTDVQTAEETAELRIALCSLYLLFGIALLAMSFNLVQEEVISNVKAIAKHLGIIKSSYDNEDD
ncbi:uncharacterized protein LOC103506966 [Diaphorina citri]|uniref:Uncharacterized protein LOC103506966 n=1 Tax=Diaphorina citri TaxID=121845 RepID=A0A3Q0ISX1_DIACI|nr:uncharacterized protein LOC103506966 [Diaphorina citri]